MHFAAALDDGVAHGLDHLGQAVGTYVGMGVAEDGRRGPVLAKHVENLLRRATLLRARVELAVAVGPCPALAEAVVALWVHQLRAGDLGQVALSRVYVLAPFQHDGPQPQLYQPQGCEQATGPGAHDDHLRPALHLGVLRPDELVILRLLACVHPHLQVDVDLPLPRVDAPSKYPHPADRTSVQAVLVGQPSLQPVLLGSHLGRHPYLVFVHHCLSPIFLQRYE